MKNVEKEIEKRVGKKNKKSFRKWWNKNGYIAVQIVLWPISIPVTLYAIFRDKRKKKIKESLTFSNELCKKYLDKMIPVLVAKLCDESDVFLISNSRGDFGDIDFWDFHQYSKRKTKMFFGKFHSEVRKFILNEYQIDGYSKRILNNPKEWREIEKLFGWDRLYAENSAEGVVFYKDSAIVIYM